MTNPTNEPPAWLEDSSHKIIPIHGSCSLGRAASNQIALPSEMVSRRHAQIQVQHQGEFWLVDFGSSNGTYLNNRRLTQPTRLRHGDRIKLGPFEFVFHFAQSQETEVSETLGIERTIVDIRHASCWLMVADIINSTQLAKELSLEELPKITGPWASECKGIIERNRGRINQFLGDGFFACWHESQEMAKAVSNALEELKRIQGQAHPAFRMVVHYGQVALGGVAFGEEERISGPEVHFVFRLEKLAGNLGENRLLSQAAAQKLAGLVQSEEVGWHSLQGFDSNVPVYAF